MFRRVLYRPKPVPVPSISDSSVSPLRVMLTWLSAHVRSPTAKPTVGQVPSADVACVASSLLHDAPSSTVSVISSIAIYRVSFLIPVTPYLFLLHHQFAGVDVRVAHHGVEHDGHGPVADADVKLHRGQAQQQAQGVYLVRFKLQAGAG